MSNRDMSETTMALLGKLLGPEVTGRDAIHVAVVPVTAAEILRPGEHVGLVDMRTVSNGAQPWVGIVDPYLPAVVDKGERFFLFLYPRTITSLRHEWTHPAFEKAPSPQDESRAWIEAFAVELDQTYNRLMEAADSWQDGEREKGAYEARHPGKTFWNDNYTYDNSETYKNVDRAKWPIFWEHYERVRGVTVPNREATFFTCSC